MSIAVGFSPVAPGNSIITGGTATAPAEGGSPLGFIDALLGTLAEGMGLALPGEGVANAQIGISPTKPVKTEPGVVANLGLAVNMAKAAGLPPQDGKDLLDGLVTALTALDDAAESGEPIDPALHKKLSETLDELAGLLGIALPAPPAIDPAITAAATGEVATPDAGLDPLAEITKGTLPAPLAPPADGDAAPSIDELTAQFLKAAEEASIPEQDRSAKPEASANQATKTDATPAAPSTDKPIDPASPLGKLLAKLAELADTLTPTAPDLSVKLTAVVQKLASGPVDADMVAELEANLDDAGLEALLAPRPESKPATPAASASLFAAPTLPNPAIAALPPKQTEPAVKDAAPIAPSEPELATPAEPKTAKDSKPAEAGEAQPKGNDRASFAAHLSDARAEKLADQASQQTQTPTSQVKTEIGVVAPKTVHAAYQAPMQAINMPQVAFEVVRQFNQGSSRFLIRLDPPELGRIDVKMQVDGDGNVQARMTVERVETLDLMQRDQRSLEKALAQAGLDGSKTSLEFSLRQNPFAGNGQGQQQGGNGSPFTRNDLTGTDDVPDLASTTTQYRGMASASGVNLFV